MFSCFALKLFLASFKRLYHHYLRFNHKSNTSMATVSWFCFDLFALKLPVFPFL